MWTSALDFEMRKEIYKSGKLPLCKEAPGLKRVYKEIHERMTAELHELNPEAPPPSTQATRTASQRWGVSFLQHGHVLDTPPHLPGYKNVGYRKELMEAIKAAVVKGFPSANGHFYYANVKEAVARDPDVAAKMEELGYERPESVWKELKKMWPKLYLGKLIMKKQRNHAQTQV